MSDVKTVCQTMSMSAGAWHSKNLLMAFLHASRACGSVSKSSVCLRTFLYTGGCACGLPSIGAQVTRQWDTFGLVRATFFPFSSTGKVVIPNCPRCFHGER